ncbi:hypothetical protein CCR75_001647 [Bremia lactucae]|uniref:Uncharacterized protein n=1 Tax=Bremia lactucae TaxID=4779 RepID=A0A976IFP3_BRELC|nr:hypothetical protein CCR75_001647 [Bremia lactucae]
MTTTCGSRSSMLFAHQTETFQPKRCDALSVKTKQLDVNDLCSRRLQEIICVLRVSRIGSGISSSLYRGPELLPDP